MVMAFVLCGLVWTGVVQPWHIVAIALVNGVLMAFDMPTRQAFIMEMTSRDEMLNAVSLNSSVVNGARIIGPAFAGVLMEKVGMQFCFFLNGLSFLAAIIGLLMMRMPAHVRPVRAETALRQAVDGVRYVWNDFRIFVLMTLFAVVGTFGWSYSVLLPAYASDILGLKGDGYGLLMASCGVGALTGGLMMASVGHRFPKRGTVFGSIFFFSVMLILFAFNRNYRTAMALLALNSFGMMLFFSMSNTLIQISVPDEMRGRVMGVWSLVFGAVIPLGSLEVGWLAHWAGIPATIATGAVICAITAGVTLFVVQRRNVART
jgi:MFS family permease